MKSEILFSETQKFNQWWMWLFFICLNCFSLLGIYEQIVLNHPFGTKPMSNTGLILVAIFILLLTLLFLLFKLETQIKEDGIYVRFFPFHKSFRKYSWEELDKCYIRQYSPLFEYGGWGIRGFKSNRALNVSGNMGIQLNFKNSNKLLIGTKKSDEIIQILHSIGQLNP